MLNYLKACLLFIVLQYVGFERGSVLSAHSCTHIYLCVCVCVCVCERHKTFTLCQMHLWWAVKCVKLSVGIKMYWIFNKSLIPVFTVATFKRFCTHLCVIFCVHVYCVWFFVFHRFFDNKNQTKIVLLSKLYRVTDLKRFLSFYHTASVNIKKKIWTTLFSNLFLFCTSQLITKLVFILVNHKTNHKWQG